MAQEAIEITGAAAAEKWHVWGDLARATIVTGVRYAEAVGRGLAFRSSEGCWTQTAWTKVA